jgi:HSP20 family molecular chaperone IbpA
MKRHESVFPGELMEYRHALLKYRQSPPALPLPTLPGGFVPSQELCTIAITFRIWPQDCQQCGVAGPGVRMPYESGGLRADVPREVFMSKVAVDRVSPAEPGVWHQEMNIFDEIRRRAFDLFERRGRASGKDIDDWLNAEREIVFSPPSEMVEKDTSFELRVTAPEFTANELEIRVSPDSIVVEGKADSQQDRREGIICFSEFSQRELLRRFLMPKQIDPNQASASLQDGVLTIVVRKAMTLLPKPVAPELSTQQKGKISAA